MQIELYHRWSGGVTKLRYFACKADFLPYLRLVQGPKGIVWTLVNIARLCIPTKLVNCGVYADDNAWTNPFSPK